MQSISVFKRGKTHLCNHSFNDITFMAQKTSWLMGCMVMIGFYIFWVIEIIATNCAFIILMLNKSFNKITRKSSPVFTLKFKFAFPFSRVGSKLFMSFLSPCFACWGKRILSSFLSNFMFSIMNPPALFNLWSSIIKSEPFSFFIDIVKSPLSRLFEMRRPFFWGVSRFRFVCGFHFRTPVLDECSSLLKCV